MTEVRPFPPSFGERLLPFSSSSLFFFILANVRRLLPPESEPQSRLGASPFELFPFPSAARGLAAYLPFFFFFFFFIILLDKDEPCSMLDSFFLSAIAVAFFFFHFSCTAH